MNHEMLQQVLRCPTLPSLPAVAVRVLELTQNVNVSLDELGRTIQNDQALSAKILKTVNSSFYGLRRPCSTINQALVMLGLSTVKSLALSFSLVSAVKTSGPDFDYVGYWRRDLYTAVAAKCIARTAGVLQEDEAFLGGLLQDVGVMALYQALGPGYLEIMKSAGDHRGLVAAEMATLALDHPDIGAMLAQRWKLPDELVMSVRYHEAPTAAPAEHADLVRCVGLGNIAHDVLTDADPSRAVQLFKLRVYEWFGLDVGAADELIERIAAGVREIAPLFKLNTGPHPDAKAVMSKARERIAQIEAQPASPRPAFGGLLSDEERYDPLTGVLSPGAMLLEGEEVFEETRKSGKSIAAIEIGLDSFEGIAANGSADGDALLVEVAHLVQAQFRPAGGFVSRSGPSSFAVLIPGLDPVGTVRTASEVRAKIAAQSVGWKIAALQGRSVTASVGTASTGTGPSQYARVQQLFTAAKRAMEAAAAAGGNSVKAFVPRAAA